MDVIKALFFFIVPENNKKLIFVSVTQIHVYRIRTLDCLISIFLYHVTRLPILLCLVLVFFLTTHHRNQLLIAYV